VECADVWKCDHSGFYLSPHDCLHCPDSLVNVHSFQYWFYIFLSSFICILNDYIKTVHHIEKNEDFQ
jgi:hypothetical protein